MAILTAELSAWLSARSTDERRAVLDVLAAEVALAAKDKPYAIQDGSRRTVAYVVPGESPMPAEFGSWLEEPGVLETLRGRFAQPTEANISVEEFMTRWRNSKRTGGESRG